MIEVIKRSLLAANNVAASLNREMFDEAGAVAVNIMGGAGCGKTTLLEHVIPRLRERGLTVAVIEGDLATTRDSERIDALGVPVVQVLTEGGCHLTAALVSEACRRLPLTATNLLLIENVGNPICPANFDLGEHRRVAVLSTAEGDDKPTKYPYLFRVADLIVITKTDLLGHVDFDIRRARDCIATLSGGKPVLSANRLTAGGYEDVAAWLEGCMCSQRARAAAICDWRCAKPS